jgi:hypothetical protein
MTDLPLGLYRHYKGNFYNLIGHCKHSETLKELIVYQALYGDYGLWVRPLKLFLEKVEFKGQTLSRFTFINTVFGQAPSLRRTPVIHKYQKEN